MQTRMHANELLYLPIFHNHLFLAQLMNNKMLCYWCADGKIAAYWPLKFPIYRLSMNAIWRILRYTIYPSTYPFIYLHFSNILFRTHTHRQKERERDTMDLILKWYLACTHAHTQEHINTLTHSSVVIVCTK